MRAEGPCIIGGEYPDSRFSTQLNKNKEEGNCNLQNNRKKDNTKFCILFILFISKVKPSAGQRRVIRS